MSTPIRRRTTLADCLPGDVVCLLDATGHAGRMWGRTLPAGAVVRVTWMAPRREPEVAFVEVAGFEGNVRDGRRDDTCYSEPTSVEVTARVGRVIRAAPEPGNHDAPADELDPLLRGAHGALFARKDPT